MSAKQTNRSLGLVLGLTSLPFFMVVLDSLLLGAISALLLKARVAASAELEPAVSVAA